MDDGSTASESGEKSKPGSEVNGDEEQMLKKELFIQILKL